MTNDIESIMIFAAGLGTRMNKLTESQPKCLLPILGKPILEHTLDKVLTFPFKRIVINTHYFPEKIDEFISHYQAAKRHLKLPEINIIYEPVLLETAGGVNNAAQLFENKPIFTLNSDVIISSKNNPFLHLLSVWNPEKMDFLLLIQPFDKAIGYKGKGDFEIDSSGKLSRPDNLDHYKYMFAGLTLLKPDIITSKSGSLKEYYFNNPNVYGTLLEDMNWYHATRPEDIKEIETSLSTSVGELS